MTPAYLDISSLLGHVPSRLPLKTNLFWKHFRKHGLFFADLA